MKTLDLYRRARLPVTPFIRADTLRAFDVDRHAFHDVLLCDFRQFTETRHAVPVGFALPAADGNVHRDIESRSLCTVRSCVAFWVAPDVSDDRCSCKIRHCILRENCPAE